MVTGTYTDRREVSRDGLECCREVLQAVGEDRVLLGGERREPEAAAGHEVRPAPARAPLPDHGTPDHLGEKAQRPAGRREVEGAGDAGLEQVEMLDLGSRQAEVENANLPDPPHSRGGPFGQPRAR